MNIAARAAAALAIASIVVSACGSTTATPGASAGASAGANSSGTPLNFIMVTHSPVTDPYWVDVSKGLEQAGKDTGNKVTYRGTDANLNDPDQQRKNIEAAIAAKPDGLIISNPTPDSLNPAIKKASDAGIPVILVNQGSTEVDNVGAITFVGDDPAVQGQIGAEQMNNLGCKQTLVVTTPLGAIPFVDLRTNGFKDTFKGETLLAEIPVGDLNDSTRIKSIMETELQKNTSVDCVFSIGSAIIAAELEVRNDLADRGKAMHWGTIDITEGALAALKNKELDFALDAQQYSQGYYPVIMLSLLKRQAIQPATKLFLTGPAVITPDNVGALLTARGQ
jgi:simple sugar transport system substrate-binding protein